MTDRPIIFSGPMVRALLDGRKSQTRRLATSPLRKCEPGDRLYVRESWQLHSRASDFCAVAYMASVNHSGWTDAHELFPDTLAGSMPPKPFQSGWRPSIHMPRWASRLTLIVENVKFERLSDLTDEDALAEGIYFDKIGYTAGQLPIGQSWSATPVIAFRNLWRALHCDESLDADPELVALTFRVERDNIDRIAA